MWGNSPSTTPTRLFRLDFPPHLNQFCLGEPSNFPFFIIFWQDSIKGERRSTHQHTFLPNHPIPVTSQTPYLLLTPHQGKHHTIPLHINVLEEYFPCVSINIFYMHLHCSSFAISAAFPGNTTPSRSWCTWWTTSKIILKGSGLITRNPVISLPPVIFIIWL